MGSLQFLNCRARSGKVRALFLWNIWLFFRLQNATDSSCSGKKSSSAEGSGEFSLIICESSVWKLQPNPTREDKTHQKKLLNEESWSMSPWKTNFRKIGNECSLETSTPKSQDKKSFHSAVWQMAKSPQSRFYLLQLLIGCGRYLSATTSGRKLCGGNVSTCFTLVRFGDAK